MQKTPADVGVPRVIWMSSMEALPGFFEWEDDIQLIKTAHSYQGSKYQIDLLATELDRRNLELNGDAPPIRHLITEPGMVTTNIQTSLVGPVLDFLKEIIFYIVSTYVCIQSVN
jgi:3-keto steroid reductase